MLGLNTRHARANHFIEHPNMMTMGRWFREHGYQTAAIVELLDLFPTFCDIAGLPAPETLDGKSFLPLIMDPMAEGKPSAFCQLGNGRAVRTPRWRLTERCDGTAELYDHSTNEAEYHNVITNPEHAPLMKRLHGMLDKEFGSQAVIKPKK